MSENIPYDPERLLSHLLDINIVAHTHWHEAVFRVDEGHGIKDAIAGAHTKNLFLKDDKGVLWLISAEQSTQINLKTLPKTMGSGRLSFGSADRLWAALGVRPGSVTALALINDPEHTVRFVLDKTLAEAESVNFHPLTNTATTNLTQADFQHFLKHLNRKALIIDFESLNTAA